MVGLDLSGAEIWRSVLMKADLRTALFAGASFDLAIFVESDSSGQSFAGANLGRSQLIGKRKLAGVDFTGADLTQVNFKGADLTGALLARATATRCLFVESNT